MIDAQDGQVLHELDGLRSGDIWGGIARTIDFSADGAKVVALLVADSPSDSMEIRIWKTAELRRLGAAADSVRITGAELTSVMALSLSRDGELLAGSEVLGNVTIWNTNSGKLRDRVVLDATAVVSQLVFSQTEDLLLGSSWDQMVHGWRLEDGRLDEAWLLRGHRGAVVTVAQSHDGKLIASGDGNGDLIFWRNPSETAPDAAPGLVAWDLLNHLQFLSDDRTLVANHLFSNYLSFWDLELGREKQRFENMRWQSSARVSPDERWVAIARMDGSVDIIDMATRRIVTTLQGHAQEVRRIYFTPDSRRMITATVTQFDGEGRNFGTDNVVRYWEIPSGQLIQQHEFSAVLNGLALSPTGEVFAVSLENGTTELRGLPDFETIWTNADQGESRPALSTVPMMFSPDGKKLATAVAMRPLFRVHDTANGEVLFTSGLLDFYPLGLAFTADGQSIAAGGNGASVKFWNATSGQETIEIRQPAAVYEIAFSGDNQIMAVGTYALSAKETDPHARIHNGRPAVIAVHLVRTPSWQAIGSKEANFAERQ